MSSKKLLMLLMFITCSIHVIAQTDYYYYQGNKIPLTLNDEKACISIPKDYNAISERVRVNVQILGTITDDAFDIFVITRSDFEKLTTLDSWTKDTKSVILTSCYFTENNEEVCATPYLNVRLKREGDTDLLASYAEKYRLRIVHNSPLMPLWYILAITQDCDIDILKCANELYESGDFASSVPDFVSLGTDILAVRSITTATTEESSDIYDLQGRRLQGKPEKGVYIQDGKKYLVK